MFFSYYLEPLLMIAPFCKHPLRIQLNGVTNTPDELSVDTIRASWLPVFRKFVPTDEQLDIKVIIYLSSCRKVNINIEFICVEYHLNFTLLM